MRSISALLCFGALLGRAQQDPSIAVQEELTAIVSSIIDTTRSSRPKVLITEAIPIDKYAFHRFYPCEDLHGALNLEHDISWFDSLRPDTTLEVELVGKSVAHGIILSRHLPEGRMKKVETWRLFKPFRSDTTTLYILERMRRAGKHDNGDYSTMFLIPFKEGHFRPDEICVTYFVSGL